MRRFILSVTALSLGLSAISVVMPISADAEITGARQNGHLLMLQDSERSDPIAIDLRKPQVQSILSAMRNGTLPNNWDMVLPQFAAADPQMYTRCTAAGQMTANGPAIPGFTVGREAC